jgi:uncharacterized protein (DUF169 family)
MTTVKEYNGYGEELEKLLLLKTAPIAVKMLEKEELSDPKETVVTTSPSVRLLP